MTISTKEKNEGSRLFLTEVKLEFLRGIIFWSYDGPWERERYL